MEYDIGSKIKVVRMEKKLTQEQLAEQLEVSRQTISNWETGVSHSLGYHTTNPRLYYFQNIKFWRYTS